MAPTARAYKRREPEKTVLYEVIRRHYRTFIAVLADALRCDSAQIVLDGSETICTALSPDAAQEVLYYRLREAVRKNPGVLDEIKEGLQDDDLVDAPRPISKGKPGVAD